MLVFPTYQTLLTAIPPVPASVIDTDLYVHYDLSDTDCWNRTSGTDADDYLVHNLANSHNDGLLRSRTGTANSYRNGSDSSYLSYESSSGGGCLEFNTGQSPDVVPTVSEYCSLVLAGSFTGNNNAAFWNNLGDYVEGSTSSDNLFYGIGDSGAYTIEVWYQAYFDNTLVQQNRFTTFELWRDYAYIELENRGKISSYPNGSWYTKSKHRNSSGYVTNYTYFPSGDIPSSGAAWSPWYHYVRSRNSNATNDTKIYINNSLEQTTTEDTIGYYKLGYIGQISSNDRMPARIGIVRFYKGKALTSSEVTNNWNAQKSRFGH